jgi:heme exporter protein B
VLRDAVLIAGKDLRIELRARVVSTQILPFGLMVLLLFGFGISPDRRVVEAPDRTVLTQIAPGLFWLAVLLAALLAVNRSYGLESADGTLDGLRLAGLDPGGIFLGKAGATAATLVVLEVLLGAGTVLFFGAPLAGLVLLVTAAVLATAGIAAAGTLYGALAAGLRVRETLVPLLVLPVLAPVLIGATQATEAALFGPAEDGWGWVGVLGLFAGVYVAAGILSFGSLLEDA